jgi:23S rRNA (guanine2445-N2)-methyltransferase / 23S rRNA (guanine2069-N7)-methyltransferase
MSSAPSFPLIAKTFTGLESVLAEELTALGASDVATGRRMVSLAGDQELLYRANIWCRTAVRILKPIAVFELDPTAAEPAQALYAGLQEIDWAMHLRDGGTLAIDPVVHNSPITNSMYAAQMAKDAICDWFRDRYDRRPNVEKHQPDLRINLHVDARKVTVYLDASDQSLHKRGYRRETNEAPLNEVLAAGILRLVGWDQNSPLVDFMCGSGTLPIEAALLAGNIAPGIIRQQFGYMRWPDFDRTLHARLIDEARQARRNPGPLVIHGSDIDAEVVAAARDNAARAGVAKAIQFSVSNFEAAAPSGPSGTIVFNPPYDERQKVDRIAAFYRRVGDVLKRRWSGYTAWMFSGNLVAAKQIGLRTAARIPLFNGPIECRLLKFPLFSAGPSRDAAAPKPPYTDDTPTGDAAVSSEQTTEPAEEFDPTADDADERGESAAPARAITQSASAAAVEAFRNRLRRMGKHWSRWARRQDIACYRVYDREIPEVPLSIDRYGEQLYIVEHSRPHGRTPIEQRIWFDELVKAAGQELGVPPERICAHRREPSARPARLRDEQQIVEAGHRLSVCLSNRTDTGLPLDERELRTLIAAESAGKRFLNLFGRGGAASVFAAAGGASSLTVESSPGLAAWSRGNLALNGFAEPDHVVVEADALEFLKRAVGAQLPPFDLVLAAPPGSYHRRGAQPGWDPRPELLELLAALVPLVAPAGKIYFVSSVRRFKLEADDLAGTTIRELTRRTVPPDFKSKPPHRCWSIVRTVDA